ncbi:MAG: NUDIX domain-containing protein [Candidatus Falkowbacteria bacterium]
MEYLDICDCDGNLTSQKISKKEAHEQGLWHRSVHVWVINSQNEVLLQRRSPLVDNYPDKWDISAAGHVSAGEDCLTAALREIKEEIGLDIKPEELILIGQARQMGKREGYINNEINPIYIVKKDLEVTKIKKQYEEVAEVKFIPYQELQNLIKNKDASFVPHTEEYEIFFKYLSK